MTRKCGGLLGMPTVSPIRLMRGFFLGKQEIEEGFQRIG